MTMLRVVAGRGLCGRQEVFDQSVRLAAAGKALGLDLLANRVSHSLGSPSRHLTFRDSPGRTWLIRVSNHRMPLRNNQPVPHLDFVSLDGASGLGEAEAFLRRIVQGSARWFDCTDPAHRREIKRLRKRRAG